MDLPFPEKGKQRFQPFAASEISLIGHQSQPANQLKFTYSVILLCSFLLCYLNYLPHSTSRHTEPEVHLWGKRWRFEPLVI